MSSAWIGDCARSPNVNDLAIVVVGATATILSRDGMPSEFAPTRIEGILKSAHVGVG